MHTRCSPHLFPVITEAADVLFFADHCFLSFLISPSVLRFSLPSEKLKSACDVFVASHRALLC